MRGEGEGVGVGWGWGWGSRVRCRVDSSVRAGCPMLDGGFVVAAYHGRAMQRG